MSRATVNEKEIVVPVVLGPNPQFENLIIVFNALEKVNIYLSLVM